MKGLKVKLVLSRMDGGRVFWSCSRKIARAEPVTKGATLSGLHFHVHRFYDGLIYGRADPATKKTDGFCLYRTTREGKTPLYVFITYDLPDVSARVIPLLAKQIEEIKDQLE
jgi:hypothetical protein